MRTYYQQIDVAFVALGDDDFLLPEPIVLDSAQNLKKPVSTFVMNPSPSLTTSPTMAVTEPQNDERKSSFLHSILATILFMIAILCGYFALPTTKSVAVSTGTASIEKRYVTKNIEDIQVGDEVLATDSETGKVVKCKVTQVFVNNTTGIHLVSVVSVDHSQQTFNVTESHPYFVIPDDTEISWNTVLNRAVVFTDTPEDEPESSFIISDKHGNKYLGCYVATRDLQVGDKLIGPSGELSQVISNIFELHPEGITTYNFEVEHAHNYFVLAQHDLCTDIPPVLVHNMCDVKKGSKLATGGGKNAQHGRAKPLTTVQQQIAKLKKQAETSPRRERNQIQTKINNLEKKLAERKRGENHSQRPKGGSR